MMAKYLLIVSCVVLAAMAEPPPQNTYLPPQVRKGPPASTYGAPAPVYGAPLGGRGGTQDDLAEPANYQFNWEVKDAESGNDFGHQESRNDDQTQGSYHVLLADGRTLIVEYEADQNGFRPQIRYEGQANAGGGYPRGGAGAGGPY